MRPPKTSLPLFLLSLLSLSLFLLSLSRFPLPTSPPPLPTTSTSVRHILFGIASSARSLPSRQRYLRSWWDRRLPLRGFVFIDAPITTPYPNLPPLRVSSPDSHLPFTSPRGPRSAVRIARIVKDLVSAVDREGIRDVRWVVVGDDDTVFFPENLAGVLGKYDWKRWWYIGAPSEAAVQNEVNSFDMAFGGGGFALSSPLAWALAGATDDCLMRYGHLYGGDVRVFSCLAELGIGLTREPGFHQVDLRGNLFGMLSAHPLTPILSLHHLDFVEPLFPQKSRLDSIDDLFKAVKIDPRRVLQQAVCYDHQMSLTVSVSWGYVIQVFEGNKLLPDILSWSRTFKPWRRGHNVSLSRYIHDTREFPKDACKQPVVFFLDHVLSQSNEIWSNYSRHTVGHCPRRGSPLQSLSVIDVYSQKFDFDIEELKAPRRHCCDVRSSLTIETLTVHLRTCRDDELIAMHSQL